MFKKIGGGLKIRRGSPLVGVQLPLPAPTALRKTRQDTVLVHSPHFLTTTFHPEMKAIRRGTRVKALSEVMP
jgi:glutamine amidotransferase PdxT